jgi:N-glycosylase/DNA lyase
MNSATLSLLNPANPWVDLCVPKEELRCSLTLTTGQSFSWTAVSDSDAWPGALPADASSPAAVAPETGVATTTTSAWGSLTESMWVGSIDSNLVLIKELPYTTQVRLLHPLAPTFELKAYMSRYFQLHVPLAPLYAAWSASSPALFPQTLATTLPGVRVLAQPPLETLMSFLTSSNNNIPRIKQLLATLRSNHGELLVTTASGDAFRSFPTLDALSQVTDEQFRSMGFGYRAKFFVQSIKLLRSPETPLVLPNLTPSTVADGQTHEQATIAALMKLCGVGRKVADCVALFALNCPDLVPVDTHVYQIAARVDPSVAVAASPKKRKKEAAETGEINPAESSTPSTAATPSKPPAKESDKVTINDSVYRAVQGVFKLAFPGGYAGWAHSVLFVMELPSFTGKSTPKKSPKKETPRKKAKKGGEGE